MIGDEEPKYFGKYKGKVVNNQDPKGRARIQVQVEAIGLNISNWAEPSLPFAGLQSGFYFVPPLNARVWIEFEQGQIGNPLWTGCCWGGREEVPALAQTSGPLPPVVLQTPGQLSISFDDKKGILIKGPRGSVISMSDVGITISNGKGATIDLVGKAVIINGNSLIVT